MNRTKKIKNWEFFAKRPLQLGEIWRSTFSTISKKSNLEGVFEFLCPDRQLVENIKPTRKDKKVRHPHPHPHSHHRNKTKIFGVKSEILIKDKRIKWTPSRKASHLLPQGDKTKSEILIKDKRIKWTPCGKASLLSYQGDKIWESSLKKMRSFTCRNIDLWYKIVP